MKILLSALEASANLHASHALNELEKIKPNDEKIELCGIFELEKRSGALYSSKEFSAMGFLGVLHLIKKAKKALKEMVALAKSADVVLLIDSPAFNIPLAKALKKAKIKAKIIYYILPQVWAWKEYRAKIVEANCDYLASIWPFESKYYAKSSFVGHPLLDEIGGEVAQIKRAQKKQILFMPGSRKAEIKALLPLFKELEGYFEGFDKVIAVPPNFKGLEGEIYESILGAEHDFAYEYDANEALATSHFAFICSGTATLQAALIGTPFVLCYKARAFDIFLARLFVKLKHAGLANIIFDFLGKKELHAELIQNELSTKSLLKAYNECDFGAFERGANELREYLKEGASKNVAKIILNSRI